MKKKKMGLQLCVYVSGPTSKVKKRGDIGLKVIIDEGSQVKGQRSKITMKSQCIGDLSNTFAL